MKGLIIKEWYVQKSGMWMCWLWMVVSLLLAFSGDTGLIYIAILFWFFNTFASASFSYSSEKYKEYRETYEVLAVSRGQILSAKYAFQSILLIFVGVLFGVAVAINRVAAINVISVDELKAFMTVVLIGMIYQSVVSALLVGKNFILNIMATIPAVAVSIIVLSLSWGEHYSFNLSGWAIAGLLAVAVAVYLLCWKWAVKRVSK